MSSSPGMQSFNQSSDGFGSDDSCVRAEGWGNRSKDSVIGSDKGCALGDYVGAISIF